MAWEFKSNLPIYSQLLEMVELRIINGEYPLGSKMPSVRDLALEAAVNPNTVQKALTELEQKGFVYSQRTAGRFVTDDEEMIQRVKKEMAQEYLEEFVEKMSQIGYTTQDVKEWLS